MVRDSGLRQVHALFDIERTKSGILVERASAAFAKRSQDFPAGWIRNRMKKAVQGLVGLVHGEETPGVAVRFISINIMPHVLSRIVFRCAASSA